MFELHRSNLTNRTHTNVDTISLPTSSPVNTNKAHQLFILMLFFACIDSELNYEVLVVELQSMRSKCEFFLFINLGLAFTL